MEPASVVVGCITLFCTCASAVFLSPTCFVCSYKQPVVHTDGRWRLELVKAAEGDVRSSSVISAADRKHIQVQLGSQ